LAATIWAAIVPALLARKSRERFGSPKFRVWGGKPMIALILVFVNKQLQPAGIFD
ncbi:hypothetical protein MJI20_30495, partial [Salmonella enterica subsp. enterica serovar Anatum]|nr:hypothetical protein [Salmonella enterica subsp. enterica serovar Anatum]